MEIEHIDLRHDGRQWALTLSTPTTGKNGQSTVRKRRSYHGDLKSVSRRIVDTALDGVRLDLRAIRELGDMVDQQTEKVLRGLENGL